MKQVFKYSLTDASTFENIFTEPELLMNHVVVEPGQIFPKHPTDAQVYIVVLRGTLSIAVAGGKMEKHTFGQVVHVPKGVDSELGNKSDDILELIVTKYDYVKNG